MLCRLWSRHVARRRLARRPRMEPQTWTDQFPAHKRQAAGFVLRHLSEYSGLDFCRIDPGEPLREVGFHAAVFGDWDFDLAEDFEREFGHELKFSELVGELQTAADWVDAIHRQTRP